MTKKSFKKKIFFCSQIKLRKLQKLVKSTLEKIIGNFLMWFETRLKVLSNDISLNPVRVICGSLFCVENKKKN